MIRDMGVFHRIVRTGVRCGWLWLWPAAMLALAGGVQAAVIIDDFEASPALNLFQAKERGAVCSVESAPEGGHGKAAKIATGKMEGPLRLTGFGFVIDKNAPAGALWIDDVSWKTANASGAAARTEATKTEPSRSEAQRREPASAAPTSIELNRFAVDRLPPQSYPFRDSQSSH